MGTTTAIADRSSQSNVSGQPSSSSRWQRGASSCRRSSLAPLPQRVDSTALIKITKKETILCRSCQVNVTAKTSAFFGVEMCTNAPLMTSSAERRAPGATTKPITAPVKRSSRGWVDVRRSGVNATYPDFLSPLLAMGAGLGLITAPATTAIVAATPVEKHGVAAAVNDAICEIGAASAVILDTWARGRRPQPLGNAWGLRRTPDRTSTPLQNRRRHERDSAR